MRQVLIPLGLPPAMPLRGGPEEILALSGETMGTTWSAKVVRPAHLSASAIHEAIARILAGVVRQMSTWIDDSNISAFNNAAAGTWHTLPSDFAEVLGYALSVARESSGAYDPTIGTLVDVWGFGAAGRRQTVPASDAIAAAHAQSGWQRLRSDGGGSFMQPGGLRIDLSSVAKGFAVDRVAEQLEQLGAPHHLIEIGGELRGAGIKPDGNPWWVALEQPPATGAESANLPETVVALHGLSVATSGDNVRWFQSGGRHFSHTLDPRTGYPVPGRLTSVTVLHRRCMYADALATALTVLGPEDGMQFARDRNIAARFVVREAEGLREHATPALMAMLN